MSKLKTTETFIEQAEAVHGKKYNYSTVQYVNAHQKIDILCSLHGIFKQEPNEHLKGCGCPICGRYSKKHPNAKLTQTEFIEKANLIHRHKYLYDKVEYITSKLNVVIICPKHGDFKQTPNAHLCKRGCPLCASSKGELQIQHYLNDREILFIRQKIFKTIHPYNKLRFDFYLPKHNLLIEFNGLQHYKPTKFFGKNKNFEKQVDSDRRKIEFSKINNIRLLVIPYYKIDNINKILDKVLRNFS
jgi:very-short-patch-repair endonuclease